MVFNRTRPNRRWRASPPVYRRKYHSYRSRSRRPRLVSLVGLFLVAVALVATLAFRFLYTPAGAGADRLVLIPQGSGTPRIAQILADEHLIRSAFGFRLLARLDKADAMLRAGEYNLSPAMRPLAILRKLVKGEVVTYPVTIPEGFTVARIGMLLEEKGYFTRQAFDEAVRRAYDDASSTTAGGGAGTASTAGSTAAYGFPMPPKNPAYKSPLEGYLFPETYLYYKGMKPDEMVKAMLTNLDHALDAKDKERAAQQKMSIHDLLTLASIVEKEAQVPSERPIIAAVYLNRLRIGMALDADPTIKYALDEPGKIVTLQDLEVVSPYNTYKNAGLPPGPIGNPGKPSIEAVLWPANVNYLYFVAKGDGTHAFASTLDEHNRNVARYGPR